MDYTHLGRSGLLVSKLVLGTMNFGPQTPEDDAYSIMDRALEQGINFFDTANSYGGRGKTEEISGAISPRAADGARRSCWPRRSMPPWATGPTCRSSPRTTSGSRSRTACAA